MNVGKELLPAEMLRDWPEDEHLPHRLEAAYHNLDRAVESVQMADNKALIALTFQAAVVAGLALIAGYVKDTLKGNVSLAIRIPIIVFLAAFFVFFAIGTLKVFQAISPRVRQDPDTDHPSFLFYWGGIAAMDPEEFASKIRHLHPRDIADGVMRVTYNTAHIARQKFANLRIAFRFLGLQIVCYVLITILSVLPD